MTTAAALLSDTKILDNLVELWKNPALQAKLMKILTGEKSPAVVSDGELKPATVSTAATMEASNPEKLARSAEGADIADDAAQTENLPAPVLPLTKATKSRRETLVVPVGTQAFRFKRDSFVQAGDDIHDSTARADKSGTVTDTDKLLMSQCQTLEQPDLGSWGEARLPFKSAVLMDLDELETLRHTISQSNKLISAAWEKELQVVNGGVSSERSQMMNAVLLPFADTPSHTFGDAGEGELLHPRASKINSHEENEVTPTKKHSSQGWSSARRRQALDLQQEGKGFESQ